MTYTQCLLCRDGEQLVTWLPSRYGKIGKHLEVAGSSGWVVREVYGSNDEIAVKEFSRFFDHWAKIRGLKRDR